MNDYDREPYQDMVDQELCAFCGDVYTDKKFCSDGCRIAFFND